MRLIFNLILLGKISNEIILFFDSFISSDKVHNYRLVGVRLAGLHGMILALGARGSEFDSRVEPFKKKKLLLF